MSASSTRAVTAAPAATEPAQGFNWALVKSFVAVLDAGSLMGAARKLKAQQPTLSRHIAELEAQLQVPLFERTGRGVMPTMAALAIADAARQMQDGAAALQGALALRAQATTGTVRITTSQLAASHLLPALLAALRQAEPGIAIELVSSNDVANLLRREADIAVRMVRPAQGSLVARKLGDIAIVACAHRSYLKRAGTPRKLADLIAQPHTLIGYDKDPQILRAAAQAGLPVAREHFALRTDDHLAYSQLIAAGAGIGFAPRYQLHHWPGVVPLLPKLKIAPLPCWLAVHREIRGSGVVRRVYDYLAEAIPRELGRG
jgi:DNA-binding transcriptional LysR family regulator